MTVDVSGSTEIQNVRFGRRDCEVFGRYRHRVHWDNDRVPPADQRLFKDVRLRLKSMAKRAGERSEYMTVQLNGTVSTLNPNGLTPADMWCCVYPFNAPNKSYTLQVALIITPDGAELCLCLASGTSQLKALERLAGQRYLQALQRKLHTVPDSVVRKVTEALPADVRYLSAWRRATDAEEFSDLRAWLSYAGSNQGTQASVSRYLSPGELEATGGRISDAFQEMVNAAAPLFEYCFGESVPEPIAEAEEDADEESAAVVFDVEGLRAQASAAPFHLQLSDDVYRALIAAVQSGKHVILTGPPGTAKTTLAEVLCQLATDAGLSKGHVLTTATADWTTYETIGGLRPTGGGTELEFRRGLFLEAAAAGRWLIVDELNRSNFDRAFGQLFTVLSGQSVVLPYEDRETGRPIAVALEGASHLYRSPEHSVIEVPRNWRIIATMNVFDKSLLFEMSYALMRRFAFVEVPAPPTAVYEQIWRHELVSLPVAEVEQIGAILSGLERLRTIKQVGPAVFKDMAAFARQYAGTGGSWSPTDLALQLFYSFLLPQFEGINDQEARGLFHRLVPLVGSGHRQRLRTSLREVLGVVLPVGTSSVADDDVDEEADPMIPGQTR